MSDETTTEQLAEIEEQAEPVQVREGRWQMRSGQVRNVTPTPEHDGRGLQYPWWDAQYLQTWTAGGRYYSGSEGSLDLIKYLGPIEPEPQSQPEPEPQPEQKPEPQPQSVPRPEQNGLVRDVTHLLQESGVLDSAKAEQQIEELRSEVSHVQRLLGGSQRRVTQLEELVASLRTINAAQEKTVMAAGQENTDLQHRLEVVSKEWADQAATSNGLRAHVEAVEADLVQQRLERNRYQNQVLRLTAELDNKTTECRNLRIELDALQQAPQAETVATAPTSKDDRFEEGWDAGTARAVETIAEWLEPIKGAIDAADNQDELARAGFFAIDTIRHLPAIMRSLTGLTPED